QIEWATRALIQASNDTFEAMGKAAIKDAPEVDILAYAEAKAKQQALQEQFSAVTAEGGRALAAFKKAKAALEERAPFNEFVKQATGKTVEELKAEAILGKEMNSPEALAKFIQSTRKSSTSDILLELWYNALLSGPKTHLANILSNTLTALWSIPDTALTAALGKLRPASVVEDKVLFGEIGARIYGIFQGAFDGVRLAGKVYKDGFPIDELTKLEIKNIKTIPSIKIPLGDGTTVLTIGGEQIRIPTTLLMAEDAFFQAIGSNQELRALAYRMAAKEGLRGRAFHNRVVELHQNPTDAMKKKAQETARYQTFTTPLKETGRAIQRMFERHPILK
ncbi:MAG: hypothetical protein AABX59_02015, partial [Nanoarchaeota archaeon]